MIGRLTGKVAEHEAEHSVVLDVNGVGYELQVPLGTIGRARTEGDRTTLFVHTHVREDALMLYGFATDAELLRSALANMSFRPAEVDRALLALETQVDAAPLPQLIREALALLAR